MENKSKNFYKYLFLLVVLALGFSFDKTWASTIAIQSLTPSATVTASTTIQFDVVVTDISSPTYKIADSFSGSSATSSNIDSTGHFSWTPTYNDVGTHNLTITITSSSGASYSIVEQIVVNSNSTTNVSIQALYPGSEVLYGQNLTMLVYTSGFSNPSFSVSDSFSSSTSATSLSGSNISSSGYLVWTPTISDIGTHKITTYVSDSSGRTGSTVQTIYVVSPYIEITGLTSNNVKPGTLVTFSTRIHGFTNPTYSISDSMSGSSISDSNINTGSFRWTPIEKDTGTHSLTVYAKDSYGHSASQDVQVMVSTTGTAIAVSATGSSTSANLSSDSSFGQTTEKIFTSYLSLGMSSNEVLLLQEFLIKQGLFSGKATGYFGALTKAAVKNFQIKHNIQSLGVVGPATREMLNKLYSGSDNTESADTSENYQFNNPLSVGSTGTDVTELQKRLTAEGLYFGPITGRFGALTKAAVVAYQKKQGLSPLGNVGPGTRTALNK